MKRILALVGPWASLAGYWGMRGAGMNVVVSALAGWVLVLAYGVWARDAGVLTRLDTGVTLFFAVGLALFAVGPAWGNCYFEPYFNTGLYSSLFATCAVPRLWGAPPFTVTFARRSTDPKFWNHPAFVRVNLILSGLWEILFLWAAIIALHPSVWCRAVLPLALCLLVGLPVTMVLLTVYARLVKKRMTETPEPPP